MNRGPRILLLIACAIFLLQALPYLGGRWVEDESWYSIRAWTLLQEGRIANPTFQEGALEFDVDTSPPGMPLILAAVFKTAGPEPIVARSPSLLAALGTVILVCFLGCEIAGPWVGGIAAILAACDNFLFLAARCARPEAPTVMFSLLAVLLYLRSRRANSGPLAFASGLSLGAAMTTHVNGAPAALGIGLLMLGEWRWTFWRQKRFWLLVATVILFFIPVVWRTAKDPVYQREAARQYIGFGTSNPLLRLTGETIRFKGFLGMGVPGFPEHLPVRLPLVLILLGSAFWLWKTNRRLGSILLALVMPIFPWYVFMVNKNPRYLVLLAPYMAICVAALFAAPIVNRRLRQAAVLACVLFGLVQAAGNVLLIQKFRTADYGFVERGLKAAIPPGASVFGAITFWNALYDHPYGSYQRMDTKYATEVRQPGYWIMNDRVMLNGEGYGQDSFKVFRDEANAYLATHGELVGEVNSPFYGDLKIYHVSYDSPPQKSMTH